MEVSRLVPARVKPRILFIAPSAYTLGGLATWLDYLLPGLESRGWEPTLGLVAGSRYHQVEPYLAAHPYGRTREVYCATGTRRGRLDAVKRCLAEIQPDVLVTVNIPDAIEAAAESRQHNKSPMRIAMTCHGIQQDLFNDMRYLGPAIDQVICTNRLACELAVSLGGMDASRVHHARYGTPWHGQIEPAMGRNQIPVIAWVGRLEQPQKQVMNLVGVATALRRMRVSARFLVAGNGPEESRLKGEVMAQGLGDSFEFAGFVASEKLHEQVYRRADAFLLTSSWETGPIVNWEAMAMGLPVVTSRYIGSGLEGLLEDGLNCLMFETGDCDGAALQLARVLNQSELRRSLVCAGKDLVGKELTCERSIDQWDRLLQLTLAQQPVAESMDHSAVKTTAGRLDRVFGLRLAERIRNMAGRVAPESGAGGEWPHTLMGNQTDEESFWRLALQMDRGLESEGRRTVTSAT